MVKKYSMKTELYIENLQRYAWKYSTPTIIKLFSSISLINREQAANKRRDISKSMDWMSYHTMDEIYTWLDEMVALYPSFINVTTIGLSYEKRPIKLVTISKKVVSFKTLSTFRITKIDFSFIECPSDCYRVNNSCTWVNIVIKCHWKCLTDFRRVDFTGYLHLSYQWIVNFNWSRRCRCCQQYWLVFHSFCKSR